MRNKQQFKKISITEDVYDKLIEDRDSFQEDIGGGRWSISDTIREYIKRVQSYIKK